MPYDPTFPATNAEIESAPFRNQFQSLKALIDAVPAGPPGPPGPPGEVTTAELNQAIWDQTPSNVNGVVNLSPTPPRRLTIKHRCRP